MPSQEPDPDLDEDGARAILEPHASRAAPGGDYSVYDYAHVSAYAYVEAA